MSLLALCEWLAGTAWSIALHESLYAYPLIETAHVLSIMLFVGTVAIVDLRLLGWSFREVPVSELTRRILPWTVLGFVIAATTGALLFYAIPVRTYLSIFFRIKAICLALAGLNAWLFHREITRSGARWDGHAGPPRRIRVAGAVSLCAWATVIVMGRMIAYDWFDCDKPQSGVVTWAAGCPAERAEPAP